MRDRSGVGGSTAVIETRFGVAPWITLQVTEAGVRGRCQGLDAQVTVDGPAAVAVATALNRADLTPTALVEALRPRLEPLQVLSALAELRAAGVVVDRPGGVGSDAPSGPSQPAPPLAVTVAAVGVPAGDIPAQLAAAGLAVDPAGGAAIQVVLAADYRDPALRGYHERARAAGVPWCLARPTGPQLWVGPVLAPDRPGCWACLCRRLAATQPLPRPAGAAGEPGPLASALVAALTANLLARWSAGRGAAAEPGVLWVLDPAGFELTAHHLVAWPGCPDCGPRRHRHDPAHPPVRLDPAAASGSALGSRSVAAADTVRRLHRLVGPILGVVQELRPVPIGSGLHVWRAGGNPAVDAAGAVRRSLRSCSGGKGDSAEAARAGALAEALERMQGGFAGDEPRLPARLSELDGAVHPNAVQLFSEHQFAESAGARGAGKDRVPARFDPDALVDWTSLWSLTAGRPRWLPSAICWFGHRGSGQGWVADSNGCAAGNTLAEAVLAGLLELVERDAVAIWWYNRLRCPAVDLAAADDPWLAGARHRFAAIGRPVHALDVTSDLGIPVVVAVSAPAVPRGPGDPVLMGFGAHPDRAVAVRRAVGEAAQMLGALPVDRGGTVVAGWVADPVTQRWCAEATLANQPYLRPDAGLPAVPVSPRVGAGDVLADLAEVRTRVEAAGAEVLVLDQTRPEIGFPTVRVVAPGLRHFWARFGPGRLYDVPVRQGRLAGPTAEADLNSYYMPM